MLFWEGKSTSLEFTHVSTIAAETVRANLRVPCQRPISKQKVKNATGQLTSLHAWCRKLFQSTLNLQWSYMCTSSCVRVSSICFLFKKWLWQSTMAPKGVKPPVRTGEHGVQIMLSAGTGQPDSSRCLSMNVTEGPKIPDITQGEPD